MGKAPRSRWIFFAALAAFWVLIIQIVPRFLPFDFGRIQVLGVCVHSDYLAHVLLFIAMVLVVTGLRLKIRLRYLLPILLFVGFIAEMVQLYIPRRTYNRWDMVSNFVGVLVGIAMVWIYRRVRRG